MKSRFAFNNVSLVKHWSTLIKKTTGIEGDFLRPSEDATWQSSMSYASLRFMRYQTTFFILCLAYGASEGKMWIETLCGGWDHVLIWDLIFFGAWALLMLCYGCMDGCMLYLLVLG